MIQLRDLPRTQRIDLEYDARCPGCGAFLMQEIGLVFADQCEESETGEYYCSLDCLREAECDEWEAAGFPLDNPHESPVLVG